MSRVVKIESEISQLSAEELTSLCDWFLEFDASAWDQQFEADVKPESSTVWPIAPCKITLPANPENFDPRRIAGSVAPASRVAAINQLVHRPAETRIAGFDESSEFHPGSPVIRRQNLAERAADELGHRNPQGSRMLLGEPIFAFIESDLGADHLIASVLPISFPAARTHIARSPSPDSATPPSLPTAHCADSRHHCLWLPPRTASRQP